MKSYHYKQQQGFTLVEIAIVLVIIGLLLGGILKGQELINGARVRNMADQNSSVQAAYYGFIDRYRAVPGDMDALAACNAIGSNNLNGCSAGSGTIGGNANGRVDAGSYTEAAALWAHLSAANFIVGSYQGITGSGTGGDGAYSVGTVAPPNAFGGRILLWRTAKYQSTGTTSSERLGFIVGRTTPVKVMNELDIKIDDGKPNAGVLRGVSTDGADGGGVADQQFSQCMGTSNTVWNVSSEVQDCNAIYLY